MNSLREEITWILFLKIKEHHVIRMNSVMNLRIISRILVKYVYQTPKCKTLKCNCCSKNGHIGLFYFINKSHESKHGYPLSHFYKSINIEKWEKCSLYHILAITVIKINLVKILIKLTLEGRKWIEYLKLRPKFFIHECLIVSNIKWHFNSDCSKHMNEDEYLFSFFTPKGSFCLLTRKKSLVLVPLVNSRI